MFSILHISDLHRSPRDPISNAELLSALVMDRERYVNEDPPIRAPDAVIVSGDIIQGVPLRAPNAAAELANQYSSAEAFLREVANQFVAGDRSRVIVVPGNHDIDWNVARSAMSLVGVEDAPSNLAATLFADESQYRWNWKTRELYRISDDARYASRLDAYWEFHDRFYAGVGGLLRVSRGAEANLFSLCDGRIGVAAFNSCHGNDCFAFHGRIPGHVVAQANMDLFAAPNSFDLHVAVWHHSIEGPPYRTDYMDVETVRAMIGRGFRLGLYGHQHRAQAAPHQVHLPDRETMAVVSAGSLCAGAEELPPGQHRQYNVVEVADDFRSARVHVRTMTAGNLFGRTPLMSFGGKSYAGLEWELPPDLGGRRATAAVARVRAAVQNAEAQLRGGDAVGCIQTLRAHRPRLDDYGRRLLLEAATASLDWQFVLELTEPPTSIQDLVTRVSAFVATGDREGGLAALENFARALNLDAATERELPARVDLEAVVAQ